jgi:hypothetical protein
LLGSRIAFVKVWKGHSCIGKSIAVSVPKREVIKLYKELQQLLASYDIIFSQTAVFC